MIEEPKKIEWEWVCENLWRVKVDGGHLYSTFIDGQGVSSAFVPEIDLKRYESHLRDAYNTGYKDGQEDAKHGREADLTP
jgi:hypothetical protein